MAATTEQKARLRRMVAETDSATYSDTDLAGYIERYPLLDALGRDPYQVSATNPPALEANPDWSSTYDLHAAAADVWDEKAAALAGRFDFVTDGQTFNRSQAYDHAAKQARRYRSRRSAFATTLHPWPAPTPTVEAIGNGPEPD